VGAVGSRAIEDAKVVPKLLAAVASLGSPVSTVAAGPSSAAVYLVIDENVSQKAVELIHQTFCEAS
jgi:aspartokinase